MLAAIVKVSGIMDKEVFMTDYTQVAVVGAGHAGIEAALASAEEIALQMKDEYVSQEHLLLALVEHPDAALSPSGLRRKTTRHWSST